MPTCTDCFTLPAAPALTRCLDCEALATCGCYRPDCLPPRCASCEGKLAARRIRFKVGERQTLEDQIDAADHFANMIDLGDPE